MFVRGKFVYKTSYSPAQWKSLQISVVNLLCNISFKRIKCAFRNTLTKFQYRNSHKTAKKVTVVYISILNPVKRAQRSASNHNALGAICLHVIRTEINNNWACGKGMHLNFKTLGS